MAQAETEPVDPVERALARAITLASEAGQYRGAQEPKATPAGPEGRR